MASVFHRKGKNGKNLPKWSYSWKDSDGRWRSGTGSTDRAGTLRTAQKLEDEASLVKSGVIDRRDQIASSYAMIPIDDLASSYGLALLNRGDTEKHAWHVFGAIKRTLHDSGARRLSEISQDALSGALKRLYDRTSARTANHALGAVKAFLRWCEATGRIRSVPSWVKGLKPYNERINPKHVRRALTAEELNLLIATTESSEMSWFRTTGPERAALYRIASMTGFRANELRNLREEDFRLAGDDPCVICRAAYSKHRREDRQPIRRSDVPWLLVWLTERRGRQVLSVPEKTAEMLRRDLMTTEISYETSDGIVDFHSLRATYITLLAQSGIDPKRLQRLARHSTITLTLDKYVKVTESDVRKALEGDKT